MKSLLVFIFISLTTTALSAPLRITITEGVIEPLPYAAPTFIGETGASNEIAAAITELIKDDLLPDLNEAKEVQSQLDALLDLLSDKRVKKIKSGF